MNFFKQLTPTELCNESLQKNKILLSKMLLIKKLLMASLIEGRLALVDNSIS